jgi:parvulin-like peptidyl-prolyl isomerase
LFVAYFLLRNSHLVRVLYSLFRILEVVFAQELYFRIQDDGHPFADLARQYSEGQEAQTGGLIGPVELSVPHPTLGGILSISQPGQLWPPTRVGEWFVIVRLEKFFPARLDEPTRLRLLDELFNAWLIEQVKAVLDENLPSLEQA